MKTYYGVQIMPGNLTNEWVFESFVEACGKALLLAGRRLGEIDEENIKDAIDFHIKIRPMKITKEEFNNLPKK